MALLDDDDCFSESRISKCLMALNESDAAVTTWDEFISDGESIGVWKKPALIGLEQLLYRNRVGNTILVKTAHLRAVGAYDLGLGSAQDHDLVVRLADLLDQSEQSENHCTNRCDRNHIGRITTSRKAWVGYYDCYVKHKAIMTRSQSAIKSVYDFEKARKKKNPLADLGPDSLLANRAYRLFQISINLFVAYARYAPHRAGTLCV